MTFLLTLLARWGVSEKLRKPALYAAGIVLLIAVLSFVKCSYDRSVIAGHEAKIGGKVEKKAREGDAAARTASDQIRNETEASNEEARRAADNSSDPLRDGLNSLHGR